MDPNFVICVSRFSLSYCLFFSWRERDNLLALWYMLFSCTFVTSPYVVLGQVWYLIVLIPDLSLFHNSLLASFGDKKIADNTY